MRIDRDRRTHTALAAALTLAGASAVLTTPAGALARAAGTEGGAAAGVSTALALSPDSPVAKAQALADGGRLVEARALLGALASSPDLDRLEAAERTRALELMKSVDGRIQTADPLEISLQKAELSLADGDLLMAERQARAVTAKSTATPAQRERADGLLSRVVSRRDAVRPAVEGLVEQARQDFASGKYAEAKAAITAVLRSGVALSADRATELERAQLAIVDMERTSGRSFDASGASLALLQPGTVRRPGGAEPGRSEPLPGGVQPGSDAPSGSSPLAQAPAQTPPPPAPPADAPAAAPAPAPAPAQDDLVTAAMRAEAARIIAEADRAYDGALYSQAIDKYTLALAQFRQYIAPPEADRVQRRVEDARARLGTGGSGADLAASTQGTALIIRQRAQAEFTNYSAQARAALQAGNTARADEAVAAANLSWSRARGYFNDAENADFETQLTQLRAEVRGTTERLLRDEEQQRTKAAADAAAGTEAKRLADRSSRVNENIDRVRALQQERKYDEALQIVDQTLFIDPNNPTALLLRDILRDITIYAKFADAQEAKQWGHANLSIDNERANIPPLGLIEYPRNWPAKTFERGEMAAYAETPENRKVLASLGSPANKIPLDLNDNSFEDVVRFLTTVTQLNIDPDWESLATVGVERGTRVTLKLQPVTVQTALDRVLAKVSRDQFSRAAWAVKDGMVIIGSDEALRKDRTLVIYNIQDLLFTIPNHRQVPSIDLNSVLQQSQGGSGQSPFQNDNQQNQPDDPVARERRIRQIVDIIQQNVDFEGWKDNGGETGALQELNGSLIITNTPRNHREIVGLLSKLREIRNMQINVESKFLLVNQQWFEQIGFDLDVVFNAGSNQVRQARTGPGGNANLIPSDFFNFASSGGLVRTTSNPPAPAAIARPANADQLSPIGAGQNSLGLTRSLSEGDFASGILSQAPALGIAGQFLDDIQVDFLIQATQADKRSVRLTAPRLTFTNGQTANIYVVTQQAFVSGLNPIVGDSAVGFNPQVSVLSEGVTLLVEGVISSDRRYVTLNVDTGVARLDRLRQSSVSAVAGGQLVNSANTQSFVELPQITVTRIRTTATVPDEGTILLGGQRLITEVEVETGVPVLSKIPIINRFFTNRLETKEEQTLLILIKPTILIQTEEEEKAHPGVTDQFRSGLGIR